MSFTKVWTTIFVLVAVLGSVSMTSVGASQQSWGEEDCESGFYRCDDVPGPTSGEWACCPDNDCFSSDPGRVDCYFGS